MTIEQITIEAFDLFDDLINGKFSAIKFNQLCIELKNIGATWEDVGNFICHETIQMDQKMAVA